MTVEFLEYLRPDYKFSSKEELIEQMNKDKEKAYELRKTYENAWNLFTR